MPATLTLASGDLTARLSTRGGALISVETRDGLSILHGGEGHGACFPLVPVGNRIGGNGFEIDGVAHRFLPNTDGPLYLHGDGWLADWQVAEVAPRAVRLMLDHPRPGHSPHVYRAWQDLRLEGGCLRLELTVENRGPAPMPFGLGFHPYFPREGAVVAFAADRWWAEGAGHLPAARKAVPAGADFSAPRALPEFWLNNAYEGWGGRATIRWPDRGMALTLTADPLFSTLMAYAPDSDRSFFCLEPMSHLPNALGLFGARGMHVLAPGESLRGAIALTITTGEQP